VLHAASTTNPIATTNIRMPATVGQPAIAAPSDEQLDRLLEPSTEERRSLFRRVD
jgi:hypothetical protein